jgi:LysR family glycine cleavage system transcriptional activator
LLPRLPQFQALHPALRLYLHTSTDLVDFVRTEHQVAIRFGSGPRWPGVEAEKLLGEWLVPVCTPALFRERGLVDDPSRLDRYPLLHSDTEPWTMWRDRATTVAAGRSSAPTPQFNDSTAIVRSAVRGQGLALALWTLVADEVAEGTLVLAGRKPLPYHLAHWFVSPRRVRTLDSVKSFRAWIFGEAARFPRPEPVALAAGG